jgi:membrane protease YdiL (CAAX protease family)
MAAGWLGEAVLILTMLTPFTSSLFMLLWAAPESDKRRIPSLLGLAGAGLKGWPLAVAAPYGIHLVGIAVLSSLGLAVFAAPDGGFGVGFALKTLIGLFIGTLLAAFEDVGWRGYLLPRMATGRNLLLAMILVGGLHGLWHLPLILLTPSYHPDANLLVVVPMFLLTLTLAGVFYGFLRVWTGSVWPVAIAHGAANGAWELFARSNTTRTPLVQEFLGGESGLFVILGLALISAALALVMRRRGFVSRIAAVA